MANNSCRSKEEREEWEKADPEEREKEFLPTKYNSLRKVPAWGELVKERFERCMVCLTQDGTRDPLAKLGDENRTFIWLPVCGRTDSTSTPILFFPSFPLLQNLNLSPPWPRRFSVAMRAL